jgi:hypothetical protein
MQKFQAYDKRTLKMYDTCIHLYAMCVIDMYSMLDTQTIGTRDSVYVSCLGYTIRIFF